MVIFMILNLFRFKKNMSSRTKINRTVFFGAISITRFCVFFRYHEKWHFPSFFQQFKFLPINLSKKKPNCILSWRKLLKDSKNDNKNFIRRHLDVIMSWWSWHFRHFCVFFWKKKTPSKPYLAPLICMNFVSYVVLLCKL